VPFRGETPLDTIFKHLHEPPLLEGPGREALPASVVPVLRKALAKEPSGRYSAAGEFAVAMTQARDAAGVAPVAKHSSASGIPAGAFVRRAGGAAAVPLPSPTLQTLELGQTARHSAPTVVSQERGEPTQTALRSLPTRVSERHRGEAPRRPADAAPPPRNGTGMVFGIAAVLLVVAVGGVAFMRRTNTPSPTPASTPATTVPQPLTPTAEPAVAATSGTLVIDAIPWGEVIAVVDASGRHHEPDGAHYTPLAIALPPGTYNVEVRNPGAAEPLARVVTVRSQALERVSVAFRRVGAQEYLQKAGF
jgi:hypothetical protein